MTRQQLDRRARLVVLQPQVDDAVQIVHERHLVVVAPARVQDHHYASTRRHASTIHVQLQQAVVVLLPLVHHRRVRLHLPRIALPAVDEERRERAAHEQPLAAGGEARREHRVLERAQLLLQLARPRPDAHLAVVGGAHDLAAVSLRVNGDRRGLRSSRWT